MFYKRIRRSKALHTELNITAFMNLMVVLVPFLLITAVFSQVSILKLNLPGSKTTEETPKDPPMQLEVILRSDRLVLAESQSGVIAEYPYTALQSNFSVPDSSVQDLASTPVADQNNAVDQTDSDPIAYNAFNALNLKLQQLKARANEATTISILAEPDTPYDLIIQTMDAVRLIPPAVGSEELSGELFPDVSLGSAPMDDVSGAASAATNPSEQGSAP